MSRCQVNFTVIDETDDLLVVNKPAGVLVHPTKPGGPITLWDGLRELLAYEIANGGQVSIINRLDRETSGLTLIAKHAAAARTCAMAMQAGCIQKEYLALTLGWPSEQVFTVDAPMLRLGEVAPSAIWLKRAVHPTGAVARTEFQVLQRLHHPQLGRISAVRARPITGRTHQIRVHLAHVGCPVVGDKIYGPDEQWYLHFVQNGWTELMASTLVLPRHALHSASLAISFGSSDYHWEAPTPQDLTDLLEEAK
jgi:23S rRNA pseudouridine1911/1915/1917 synthase